MSQMLVLAVLYIILIISNAALDTMDVSMPGITVNKVIVQFNFNFNSNFIVSQLLWFKIFQILPKQCVKIEQNLLSRMTIICAPLHMSNNRVTLFAFILLVNPDDRIICYFTDAGSPLAPYRHGNYSIKIDNPVVEIVFMIILRQGMSSRRTNLQRRKANYLCMGNKCPGNEIAR